jgi:nucleoside phosphorylase
MKSWCKMYLPTFEKLAARLPSLREVFEASDSILAANPGASLDPGELATCTGRTQQIALNALGEAVTAGTLSAIEGRHCGSCGQFNKNKTTGVARECSACGSTDITNSPEFRYRLTAEGAAALSRALNGLESSEWPAEVTAYRCKVDVVLISMKPEEFGPILARFPPAKTVRGRRDYNMLRVKTQTGDALLVATIRTVEQAEGEAQNATRDAIEDLDPNNILLVGIAGAIPGDVTLGDIVFGTRVHDLTVGAIDEHGIETFEVGGGPMHRAVQVEVANLQAVLPAAFANIARPTRPEVKLENLEFTAEESDTETRKAIVGTLSKRIAAPFISGDCPYFTDGAIASSDRVVKNVALVRRWKVLLRKMLAVEMELAGAYRASRTREKEYRILSIRCISDVVGLKREAGWEAFACEMASAAAAAYVKTLEPR